MGIGDRSESKFGRYKELIVFIILKYKYCVYKSRDISRDHFAKNRKLLTIGWLFKKKKSSDSIFLIHIKYF